MNLSIHGRDRNGNNSGLRYNPNPQEPKLPSTARGKRRMEQKKAKAGAK